MVHFSSTLFDKKQLLDISAVAENRIAVAEKFSS
jgi:hypothetical protein